MLFSQHHKNYNKHHKRTGVRSCIENEFDSFKFELVAESCAASLPIKTRLNDGIKDGVDKDSLAKDTKVDNLAIVERSTSISLDQLDYLVRSTSNSSDTSLPLSVVTELFWDSIAPSPRPALLKENLDGAIAKSPRPPLLKQYSYGGWGSDALGSEQFDIALDIADTINDVPTSPIHTATALRNGFEKRSTKPCESEKQSTKPCEFEKQLIQFEKQLAILEKQSTKACESKEPSTKPCDVILKPSTKQNCDDEFEKVLTKKNCDDEFEKVPTKLSNKRKRKSTTRSRKSTKRSRKSSSRLSSVMRKSAPPRKQKRGRGRSNKWTRAEDQRLRDAVKKFGCKKNWNAVSAIVGTRTPNQCGQRWRKCLRPELANVHKGPWNDAEDMKLRKLIRSLGTKGTWQRIAKAMGYSRSPKQCRERWHNFLDPDLRVEWTDEEDDKLMDLFNQFGSQWANIAKKLRGRTGDRVKQRLHKIYNKNNEVLVY